jgi:hypothetical protein
VNSRGWLGGRIAGGLLFPPRGASDEGFVVRDGKLPDHPRRPAVALGKLELRVGSWFNRWFSDWLRCCQADRDAAPEGFVVRARRAASSRSRAVGSTRTGSGMAGVRAALLGGSDENLRLG